MPIAGAPRTTMVRIASATSAALRHSTSTASTGSRRWSRKTTRSFSSLRICSGSSKRHRSACRIRPLQGGLRDREQAIRLEDPHADRGARLGRVLDEPDGECLTELLDRRDLDQPVATAELPEDGDERAVLEVDAAEFLLRRGGEPPGERRDGRTAEGHVSRGRLVRRGGG